MKNSSQSIPSSNESSFLNRNKFIKEKHNRPSITLNKEDFERHFPILVEELTNLKPELKHITNWYKDVLNYNVVAGKRIRPLSFLNAYQIIMEHYDRTIDEQLIYSLAWALELLQVMGLVADDIMNHSSTRKGSICWYKKEEVGLIAINDCFFLNQCVYKILRKFKSHKFYTEIIDLFKEVNI